MYVYLLGVSAAFAQTPKQLRDSLYLINCQIENSPYSADLHLRKASINVQLLEWDYAIDEYNLVLRNDSNNLAALFYRAYVNNKLRRYELSANDYNSFLRQLPRSIEARLGLANTYIKLHRYDEAMSQMNLLVDLHPDSAIVYAIRADHSKTLGYLDSALMDWERAIQLAPNNSEYMVSKAEVLILMGKKRRARKLLDQAVSLGVHRNALRDWYDKCK